MATVTLTLTDTPTGGVSIYSTYTPAIGSPCSAAQSTALEILSRTKKQWAQEQGGAVPTAQQPEGVPA
jgi:hypothetical protein